MESSLPIPEGQLQPTSKTHIYGKATEAISKGDAVQFAGNQGDHLLVKKAVPSEINTDPNLFIGLAKEDVANNAFSYFLTFGKIERINTSIYTNPILYYDSSATSNGKLTDTVPPSNKAKITVAAIERTHQTQGIIMVRPTVVQLDKVTSTTTVKQV